jgi:hypothetical protein
MRVTPGAAGKIMLSWTPKFSQHIFFSSNARDADNLWCEGQRDQQSACMNNFLEI